MGLFDSTRSTTNVTNEYLTSTNTQQTDQGGNQGLNFSNLGGGVSLQETSNTSVTSIDGGAIKAAQEIAAGSYGVASGVASGGLNLGGKALDTIARVNNDSLSLLSGLVSGSIDASNTIARDAMTKSSQAVESAITGFSSLAKQNTASSDDRVIKIAMAALAALALVFVLPRLKGGKALA